MMSCIQTITAVASAIFSGCIVFLTCRQKKIQEQNYQLSLFKEHFKAVEPVFSAYSYFDGGLNSFVRQFVFESKDSPIPEKGYQIKADLEASTDSFLALFQGKKEDYLKFIDDYNNLLEKARVMCQNLPKQQMGPENNELHSFLYELGTDESINEYNLAKGFPRAKKFISEFCESQSIFIKEYSLFIKYLKDKVVI